MTKTATGDLYMSRTPMESPNVEPVHAACRRLVKASSNHQNAAKNYKDYPGDDSAIQFMNTAKELRAAMDALVAVDEPSFYGAWLATWKGEVDVPAGRDQPPPRPASRGRKKAAARR